MVFGHPPQPAAPMVCLNFFEWDSTVAAAVYMRQWKNHRSLLLIIQYRVSDGFGKNNKQIRYKKVYILKEKVRNKRYQTAEILWFLNVPHTKPLSISRRLQVGFPQNWGRYQRQPPAGISNFITPYRDILISKNLIKLKTRNKYGFYANRNYIVHLHISFVSGIAHHRLLIKGFSTELKISMSATAGHL
jgi:hypothetical protein